MLNRLQEPGVKRLPPLLESGLNHLRASVQSVDKKTVRLFRMEKWVAKIV